MDGKIRVRIDQTPIACREGEWKALLFLLVSH